MRQWLYQHHPFEVSGLIAPAEAPEVVDSTCTPLMLKTRATSISLNWVVIWTRVTLPAFFEYNQLLEVCSSASLSLPLSIANFICLAFCSVLLLSGLAVASTQLGALDAILMTTNEHFRAL